MKKKYILQVDDYDTDPLAVFDTMEDAKKFAEARDTSIELTWDSMVEDTAHAFTSGYYGRVSRYIIYPVDYFPSEV